MCKNIIIITIINKNVDMNIKINIKINRISIKI